VQIAEQEFFQFFTSSDGLVYFHDLKSFLEAMRMTQYKDEEWRLFIGGSK